MQSTRQRCSDLPKIAIPAIAFLICALAFNSANAQSGMGNPFGGGGGGGPLGKEPPPPPRMPVFGPTEIIPLLDVKVLGNSQVPEGRIRSMLETRTGRNYDANTVEKDVRTLIESGLFRDVKTYKKESPEGVAISFELFERPLIQYVRFVGNEKVKDKSLTEAVGLKPGGPLNRHSVEEGKRRLQNLYRDRGFNDAHVSVVEGTDATHRGVAYQINEGTVVRIQKTSFVGNTIASSARLKTQIDSKPGVLYFIGGKLSKDTLEQDVVRLTSYYRSLGFFGARVGREVETNPNQTWAHIKFVIDEGPRYRIRNVKFIGNEKYAEDVLLRNLTTQRGEFYNVSKLRHDLKAMRDLYGSNGYVTSDIDVKPSFLEEPGLLDLVYHIDEGQQFQVGRIIVNINGEYAQTKRSVVLNRLSIKPGDIVDVRELRASERRLQSSQLFLHNPAQGVSPEIVVKATDPNSELAQQPKAQFRGQSPRHTSYRPQVDIHVNGDWNPNAPLAAAEPQQ